MGKVKRREPLPYNAFKMTRDFRGRLELGILIHVYKTANAVNDLTDAHSQMNASCLTPPLRCQNCIRRLSLMNTPCLLDAPFENYSEILELVERSKIIQFIQFLA